MGNGIESPPQLREDAYHWVINITQELDAGTIAYKDSTGEIYINDQLDRLRFCQLPGGDIAVKFLTPNDACYEQLIELLPVRTDEQNLFDDENEIMIRRRR